MKKIASILCALSLAGSTLADEGMWPLNQLPKQQIYEQYGVQLKEEWIDHVQQSCLRVSFGGSASFVSPHGLIMTNHHVGSKAIYDFSTEEHDLMKEGFYARSLDQELKCPNMYVDQLVGIRDVTAEINGKLTAEMPVAEREEARKAAMAAIKEEAQKESGLQPEIVTLYQGARYHLYLYKRYSDVRLVMAPEARIAFFGGEIENFEFPSHDLDVTFFRVYENDEPLQTKHFLSWSSAGPQLEEALFVLGHPGRTERIFTAAHLTFYRDHAYPLLFQFINERLACFDRFGKQSEENARIASQDQHRYANAHKAYTGLAKGLQGESIIPNKQKFEASFLPTLSEEERQPWQDIAASLEEAKSYYVDHYVLEGTASNYSKMFTWARHLVRLAEEKTKPNEERLKEYIESELPTLEIALLSTEPVYLDFERDLLTDGLDRFQRVLGQDHPAVQAVLAGKSVEEKVDELMTGTQLADLAYRQELYQNPAAVQNSQDPLIVFAKTLDPYSRELREKMDHGLMAVRNESYTKIVRLLFDRYGEAMYPDATFTLRLSIGSMIGYQQQDRYVNPTTTFGEAFYKARVHDNQEPYELPMSWREKQGVINESTPFNFVSTNDIIGGNSGSPVINAEGEVVGLIFDGNAQAATWDFEFDQEQGRAVSVHSVAILHALEHIYEAEALIAEIRGE